MIKIRLKLENGIYIMKDVIGQFDEIAALVFWCDDGHYIGDLLTGRTPDNGNLDIMVEHTDGTPRFQCRGVIPLPPDDEDAAFLENNTYAGTGGFTGALLERE